MSWDWEDIAGGILNTATGGLFSLAQPLVSYALGAYDRPRAPQQPQPIEQGRAFMPLSQSQQPYAGVQPFQPTQQPPAAPAPELYGALPPMPQSNLWAQQGAAPKYTPPPSQGLMNLAKYYGNA